MPLSNRAGPYPGPSPVFTNPFQRQQPSVAEPGLPTLDTQVPPSSGEPHSTSVTPKTPIEHSPIYRRRSSIVAELLSSLGLRKLSSVQLTEDQQAEIRFAQTALEEELIMDGVAPAKASIDASKRIKTVKQAEEYMVVFNARTAFIKAKINEGASGAEAQKWAKNEIKTIEQARKFKTLEAARSEWADNKINDGMEETEALRSANEAIKTQEDAENFYKKQGIIGSARERLIKEMREEGNYKKEHPKIAAEKIPDIAKALEFLNQKKAEKEASAIGAARNYFIVRHMQKSVFALPKGQQEEVQDIWEGKVLSYPSAPDQKSMGEEEYAQKLKEHAAEKVRIDEKQEAIKNIVAAFEKEAKEIAHKKITNIDEARPFLAAQKLAISAKELSDRLIRETGGRYNRDQADFISRNLMKLRQIGLPADKAVMILIKLTQFTGNKRGDQDVLGMGVLGAGSKDFLVDMKKSKEELEEQLKEAKKMAENKLEEQLKKAKKMAENKGLNLDDFLLEESGDEAHTSVEESAAGPSNPVKGHQREISRITVESLASWVKEAEESSSPKSSPSRASSPAGSPPPQDRKRITTSPSEDQALREWAHAVVEEITQE